MRTPILSRSPLLVVLSLIPGATLAQTGQDNQGGKQNYPDCGPSTYYQSLPSAKSQWNKKDLGGLLANTHRNNINQANLPLALIELDPHPDGGVHLLYSDQAFPADQDNFEKPDGWTAEKLWPSSRGAVSGAFTDIHNARPEETRITMIRDNMMYGECGTVEFPDVCEKPAFGGGGADTSQDGKVWMPPEQVRGDIARALMYMEVRYMNTELNLTLSDCGPFNGKMGILSQLLEWHAADPVSSEEYNRNQFACQYWQGNRNPFVDYPELVEQFYGQPQEIAPRTRTYPTCLDIPTAAPTAEQNECSQLKPGDVFIYVVESDDPDGVGFMALEPIPAGLELYMTDNPWVGYDFVGQEGVVKLVVPPGGYPAGKEFGFGFDFGKNEKWVREEGVFNIGIAGDSVFLYCYLGDSTVNPLVGFSNNNAWAPEGLSIEEYGSESSALPPQLAEVGAIVLPHLDNYRYEGPEGPAEKEDLQQAMMDPKNWKGTDAGLGDGALRTGSDQLMTLVATLLLMAVAAFHPEL